MVHQNQSDFDDWLKKASDPRDGIKTYIDIGKMIYSTRGCAGCHSLTGGKIVGPSWMDMWGSTVPLEGGASVKADEAYVRESILKPAAKIHQGFPNVMPSFEGQMKDYELESVMGLMKSISSHASAEEKQAAALPVPKASDKK